MTHVGQTLFGEAQMPWLGFEANTGNVGVAEVRVPSLAFSSSPP